jgi:putative DNA primase/helicase
MKTVEALKGQEEKVLRHYGLPEPTHNRHVDCPICEKKRKFRIGMFNGSLRYICVCGTGSVIKLVMETKGYDFATAAMEIDEIIGNTSKPIALREKPKFNAKESVKMRFPNLHDIKESQVEQYLQSRGIYTLPQMSVKFSHSEYDHNSGRSYKAMVGIATTDDMDVAYSHTTYLENGKKADVEANKKIRTLNDFNKPCNTCGTVHSANVAIRMFPQDKVLGIGEGIESSLSAYQLYNIPTWSVMNTSVMKKFTAPLGVTTLYIFADNDSNGAGLAAAFTCGHKNILANNHVEKVIIRVPEQKNKDFNDLLINPMATIDYELEK